MRLDKHGIYALREMKRKHQGFCYIMRDIDTGLWARVKEAATDAGMTIRQWLFRAIRRALEDA